MHAYGIVYGIQDCWWGGGWGGGKRQLPPTTQPPYLRPTVVRNHEQRPELARQAGRPGDMDQRDRAGEPKQLWSLNTETHSVLSLLACSLYLSLRHQIASQRVPPFQSRLNLPLTTNCRENKSPGREMWYSSLQKRRVTSSGKSLICLT